MGSYVVGAYLAGAVPEYCLKGWKLVMRILQACISCRYASLTDIPPLTDIPLSDIPLSQTFPLTDIPLSQTFPLTNIPLSQAYIFHRYASLS